MKILKNANAFTGLEAAIVLIAFVVVAAVFSYVVLGAGFFTTQKSQEVVHTGVEQASSSMEIIGVVFGYGNGGTGTAAGLKYVVFTVGNTAGGAPIDMEKMIVTYISENEKAIHTFDKGKSIDLTKTPLEPISPETSQITDPAADKDGNWVILNILNDNGKKNYLLEPGEQFILQIPLGISNPGVNRKFSLTLQPAVGAVFSIHKTVPSFIDTVNILK